MTNGHEWVLKLKDQFTTPLKGVVGQVKWQCQKKVQGVDRVEGSIEFG